MYPVVQVLQGFLPLALVDLHLPAGLGDVRLPLDHPPRVPRRRRKVQRLAVRRAALHRAEHAAELLAGSRALIPAQSHVPEEGRELPLLSPGGHPGSCCWWWWCWFWFWSSLYVVVVVLVIDPLRLDAWAAAALPVDREVQARRC